MIHACTGNIMILATANDFEFPLSSLGNPTALGYCSTQCLKTAPCNHLSCVLLPVGSPSARFRLWTHSWSCWVGRGYRRHLKILGWILRFAASDCLDHGKHICPIVPGQKPASTTEQREDSCKIRKPTGIGSKDRIHD